MAHVDFYRDDFALEIRAGKSGYAMLAHEGGVGDSVELSAGAVRNWAMSHIKSLADVSRAGRLTRLTLDIRDRLLHAEPWEEWFAPVLPQLNIDVIVRVSPVPARLSKVTFTPPLRVLLCDFPDGNAALAQIQEVFWRPIGDPEVAKAYVGALGNIDMSGLFQDPMLAWPIVDVLHLSRLPTAASETAQLSPSAARPGSVGWLSRLLEMWQTRLLVIDSGPPDDPRLVRWFAAALVARGGPGVIVRNLLEPINPFYGRIIHDMPVDVIGSSLFLQGPRVEVESVFAGGGREELARVSAAARVVQQIYSSIQTAIDESNAGPAGGSFGPGPRSAPSDGGGRRGGGVGPREYGLTGTADLSPMERAVFRDAGLYDQLQKAATEAANRWEYSDHEREGVLPMSAAIDRLRKAMGPLIANMKTAPRTERHVNASLWRTQSGVPARRVDAYWERLVLRRPYQLRLQIGARDESIPTYQSTAFLEVPKMAGSKGVWIEVAVNGVGFEVEGDATQELWVPYDGLVDELSFAVRPVEAGAAVLRYTFYYRQNVLQTFRLAAIVAKKAGELGKVTDEEHSLLAGAIHAPAQELPRSVYVTRMEYAAASIQEAEQLPERTVSIVANQVADKRVITVKGKDFRFDTQTGTVTGYTVNLRKKLLAASVKNISGDNRVATIKDLTENPDDWPYRFGRDTKRNEKGLQEVLPALALAGWQLYDKAFESDLRQVFEADLEDGNARVSVAHALLAEVIPWGSMYDREYHGAPPDPPHEALGVCTAALEDPALDIGTAKCAHVAKCVLKQGVDFRKVACPLHFWGFRHRIDIPAKQQTGANDVGKGAPPSTSAAVAHGASPAAGAALQRQLTALINSDLAVAATHIQELQKLAGPANNAAWKVFETQPANIVNAASNGDLDLVYFFCHARGQPDEFPEILEFSAQQNVAKYTSDRFQGRWNHQPLVIINGCSTAAFTPDALSPFVHKFTRDGKAGGVIATEIPVHQNLAADIACRLIPRVLNNEPVGESLLAVRRELLKERNPMGLVYTLFAFSELKIRSSAG